MSGEDFHWIVLARAVSDAGSVQMKMTLRGDKPEPGEVHYDEIEKDLRAGFEQTYNEPPEYVGVALLPYIADEDGGEDD